jgi:hypothetical protein
MLNLSHKLPSLRSDGNEHLHAVDIMRDSNVVGRPWWLRLDGVPPSTLASIRRDQTRGAQPLPRAELRKIRIRLVLIVVLVLVLTATTAALFPQTGPLVAIPGIAVFQFLLWRRPINHRRQVLGFRPREGPPPVEE